MNCDDACHLGKDSGQGRAAREGGRTSIGSGGLPLCAGLDEDSSLLLAWVLGLAKGGGDV